MRNSPSRHRYRGPYGRAQRWIRRRALVLTTHGTDPSAAAAWVARIVGPIAALRELTGGWTSSMLAFQPEHGDEVVLRLMDTEPWRTHGAALTARESEVQQMLERTPVPAPHSVALDQDGKQCGYPAHLMTLLPGAIEPMRFDDGSIAALAKLLQAVHQVYPVDSIRAYQSWAWEAKFQVPDWATMPNLWREAFDLLRNDPPRFEPSFIHRDFQMRNVLWSGTEIAGLVDWVETSIGPAWLDVAHCCSHMSIEPGGLEAATAFAAAYSDLTGLEAQPYFDVMDLVGFLSAPGRPALVTDPEKQLRLEQRLHAVLKA